MSAQAKTCVFCGLDCSGVAHLRDRQGRYACAECVEAARARRAGPSAERAEAAAARQNPAPPASRSIAAEESRGYDLAEDGPMAGAPIALAPSPREPHGGRTTCPMCSLAMPAEGPCGQCGYIPSKGIQSSRRVDHRSKKQGRFRPLCTECGYDMTGVPGSRCPECGTLCDFSPQRRYDREESRRIARWSYLKPAIMLGIGLAGILIILLMQDKAPLIGFYVTKWAIFVPIGVVAFFLCCLMWVGFDAPLHRVALELAAIYAVVDLISLSMYLVVPNDIVNGLLVYFIYIALLVSMLDLDYVDAIGVALVTLLLRIGLFIILWQVFGLP